MHRAALVVMVVLGFLIAYQIVNPYDRRFVTSGRLEICVVGYCAVRDVSNFDALYPCILYDFFQTKSLLCHTR